MQWRFCVGKHASPKANVTGAKLSIVSNVCDTGTYDHWPPYLETELPKLANRPLIHPVLDESKYTESLLKYKIGLQATSIPPASIIASSESFPRNPILPRCSRLS